MRKDQLLYCTNRFTWVVCLKILIRASHSTERRKIGNESRCKILQEHVAPNKKTESISRDHCRNHLATRKMRPQSWNLATNIYKLKSADKVTFYCPIVASATPTPTSKSPEDREFVVDSGTSMHKLSKKDLSSEEMETLRRSRTSPVVVDGKWRSENKQGSTSVCSRSWPLRHCAITRRNACISNAW